jgi:iron complex transport system substrate-binding protein
MRTKKSSFDKAFLSKKRFAVVEIAIVLCSVFLVAIPAIAAEQTTQKVSATVVTTASEDDYVLDIYGNANEDDTIDMGDVVYTKLAIFGKKPKTELCDAKYDGRINVLDVIQTKLIILGKEKEISIIDGLGRIVTVKKPVEKAVACYLELERIRSLKVEKDRIVGVHYTVQRDKDNRVFFPEYQDKPTVASEDPESVLKLRPDLVIVQPSSRWGRDHLQDVCEAAGITVFRATSSCGLMVVDVTEKFGYIFDKKDEAAEFIDWYEGVENSIMEKVESIPEGDKPKVYLEYARYKTLGETHSHIAKTGGKSIFDVITGSQAVDPEAVARLNPDIILIRGGRQNFAIGGHGIDDTTEFKEAREELMSRKELEDVTAVKTGKVYVFNSYITSYMRPAGARQFILDAYQAKWFHPEIFEDLDPKAVHQEYLTRFQGLDIDLDEEGVFVYHPEEHPDGS